LIRVLSGPYLIDPLPAGPQISDGKIEPNPNLGKKGKGTSNIEKRIDRKKENEVTSRLNILAA